MALGGLSTANRGTLSATYIDLDLWPRPLTSTFDPNLWSWLWVKWIWLGHKLQQESMTESPTTPGCSQCMLDLVCRQGPTLAEPKLKAICTPAPGYVHPTSVTTRLVAHAPQIQVADKVQHWLQTIPPHETLSHGCCRQAPFIQVQYLLLSNILER